MAINTERSALSKKPLATLLSALLIAGCASFKPEAVGNADLLKTLQADKTGHMAAVEPLGAVLTLEEAIARAIKYNADRRLKAMEEAVAEGTLEVGNYDMLPKLVASAGYRDRSNDLLTKSYNKTSNTWVGGDNISSERRSTTSDLMLSWSLLDFGQSYYAAKQNADRVMIAQERKRKALHLLVQDVRTAYWRVVAAQALGDTVRAAVRDAEAALQDARRSEGERLRNPLEPLRFQRQLLENIRLLESVEQELSTAQSELASLTSLPLGVNLKVETPKVDLQQSWLEIPVGKLEEHALVRNADIREGFYNGRIAREETHRAMLKMFPGISFNYGTKNTDDSYAVNKSWTEAGAQVSLNLFGFLSAPAQMRLADAGVALADQKRLVTQMAVLAQLHIARQQLANTLRQYERADAIAGVEERITSHVSNQAEAEKQSKLDKVSQQTSLILAQLRRFQALSNAQAAASKLQATLGYEPVVEASSKDSLADLSRAIGKSLQTWSAAAFSETVAPAAPVPVTKPAEKTEPAAVQQQKVEVAPKVAPAPAPAVAPEAPKLVQAVKPAEPTAAPKNISAYSPEQEATMLVYQWVQNWREQNFAAHFASYAKGFKPGQTSRADFEKNRIATARKARNFEVQVLDPKVQIQTADKAQVTFEQQISERGSKRGSMKQLVLVREGGNWKILEETTTATLK